MSDKKSTQPKELKMTNVNTENNIENIINQWEEINLTIKQLNSQAKEYHDIILNNVKPGDHLTLTNGHTISHAGGKTAYTINWEKMRHTNPTLYKKYSTEKPGLPAETRAKLEERRTKLYDLLQQINTQIEKDDLNTMAQGDSEGYMRNLPDDPQMAEYLEATTTRSRLLYK